MPWNVGPPVAFQCWPVGPIDQNTSTFELALFTNSDLKSLPGIAVAIHEQASLSTHVSSAAGLASSGRTAIH